MKKKKFLVLLPILTLTGCIGANWECTIDHALNVTGRILTAQKALSFGLPKRYFYSSEYFELATSYNSSGEKTKTECDKYQDTALMYLDEYKLKFVSKYRSFTEKETAEIKTTSVTWVYVKPEEKDKTYIYFVYNNGAADGKTYVKVDISDKSLSSELFIEYCSRVFDPECLDIKGDSLLDLKQVQNDVDYEDTLDNISSEVHYYSKREGTLSYEINKVYDGYFVQVKGTDDDGETEIIVDEYEQVGTSRESFGWDNNTFVEHHSFLQADRVRNGVKTSVTIRDESVLTLNPVVKTDDKESKDYVADYDFEEPDLASYRDVSESYLL